MPVPPCGLDASAPSQGLLCLYFLKNVFLDALELAGICSVKAASCRPPSHFTRDQPGSPRVFPVVFGGNSARSNTGFEARVKEKKHIC